MSSTEKMLHVEQFKTCRKCRTLKSVDQFPVQSAAADGLNPWCRSCRNEWMRIARRSGKFPYQGEPYKSVRVGNKIMREHRFVVEQALGVKLAPSVHVHHLNGKKKDNRLTNLETVTPKGHGLRHFHERSLQNAENTAAHSIPR